MLWRRAAIVIVLTTISLRAQAPQEPAFEVASVKRNTSGDTMSRYQLPPSGTVNITNATLRQIIEQAYQIDFRMARFTLVGASNDSLVRGPDRLDQMSAPHFDIQGKPPADAAPGTQRAMLRALLADRFKLRAHRENRNLPVYALRIAREGRLGPSLRASSIDCDVYEAERRKTRDTPPPQGADGRPTCTSQIESLKEGRMTLRWVGQISLLALGLQGYVDRPIVEDSGLKGVFEWSLSVPIIPNGIDDLQAGLFTAVQEQLGLKLEPTTLPYEVLVIDSVQMPTEN